MTDYLPQAVREGLRQARRASLHRNDRLCIHDGDTVYRVLRFWSDGISIDARHGDKLRGRVEIYDGARHLYQCLIENGDKQGDEVIFDFKWLHPVTDKAPVDFEQADFVPAGLIARA